MIRLAISGVEGVALRGLAGRLRGVVVEFLGEREHPLTPGPSPARGEGSPQRPHPGPLPGGEGKETSCDAAVVVGVGGDSLAVAEGFLRSGKSVLVAADPFLYGTPLGRLAQAAREGNGRLAVANGERYLASRRLIKEQLEAGKLGDVGLVRMHRWGALWHCLPAAGKQWHGTGALLPEIDLALWLIGRQPQVGFAALHGSGSAAQVHLGFSGGAMALIDYADPGGDAYRSLTVIGSAGAAYADDHANMQLHFAGGQARALPAGADMVGVSLRETKLPLAEREVYRGEREACLAAMVQDFVDSVAAGREMASGIADWQIALKVAEAARLSAETRRAVSLEGL